MCSSVWRIRELRHRRVWSSAKLAASSNSLNEPLKSATDEDHPAGAVFLQQARPLRVKGGDRLRHVQLSHDVLAVVRSPTDSVVLMRRGTRSSKLEFEPFRRQAQTRSASRSQNRLF